MSRIDLHLFIEDTAIGDSLQALAFVAGTTIEEAALDALSVIKRHSVEPEELVRDAVLLAQKFDVPKSAVLDRLREYRDLNGLTYPDYAMEAEAAAALGEIDLAEYDALMRAGSTEGGR